MISIQLEQKGASITTQRNGRFYTRPVDSKELMTMIQSFSVFETGLLPPNTRYYSLKGDRLITIVEFPYSHRSLIVKHDGSNRQIVIEDVPISAGMFIFDVQLCGNNSFKLNTARLWGLPRKGLTSLDDKLFRYPAPNVEPSGHICWGGYQYRLFSDMKTVSSLEGVVRAYFRTNFNDHIWGKAALAPSFPWGNIKDYRKVEQYFQKLVELGEFKDEWLSPTTNTPRSMLKCFGITA